MASKNGRLMTAEELDEIEQRAIRDDNRDALALLGLVDELLAARGALKRNMDQAEALRVAYMNSLQRTQNWTRQYKKTLKKGEMGVIIEEIKAEVKCGLETPLNGSHS